MAFLRKGLASVRPTTAALGLVVAAVIMFLCWQRFQGATAAVGEDFKAYLSAASEVAHGHNPYDVKGYVYPPLIAIDLAPFADMDLQRLWSAWTVASLVSAVLAAAAMLTALSFRVEKSWQRVGLFGFFAATCLHFWPTTITLWRGQADLLVLAVLAGAFAYYSRARSVSTGFVIGIAGLLKAWPAGVGLALLRREEQGRGRAVLAIALTMGLPLFLIGTIGDWSWVSGMISNIFHARSQSQLVSDSVWGIPRLNFSDTGIARPLVVSGALRVGTAALLLAWVVLLLSLSLISRNGDRLLAYWNVTLCVVLLLPVSHLEYSVYALPLLWLWGANVLTAPRLELRPALVFAALVLWWVVLNRSWPDNGSPSTISSLRYSVVFAANLLACTLSVWGGMARAHHAELVNAKEVLETSVA